MPPLLHLTLVLPFMILAQIIASEHLPTLAALLAIGGVLWRIERGRKELLATITEEVTRNLGKPAPRVEVQSPLLTRPDDELVRSSTCALHRHGKLTEIAAVRERVDRLERRLDDDIKRLHERIDDLPTRVVELIAETKRAGRD